MTNQYEKLCAYFNRFSTHFLLFLCRHTRNNFSQLSLKLFQLVSVIIVIYWLLFVLSLCLMNILWAGWIKVWYMLQCPWSCAKNVSCVLFVNDVPYSSPWRSPRNTLDSLPCHASLESIPFVCTKLQLLLHVGVLDMSFVHPPWLSDLLEKSMFVLLQHPKHYLKIDLICLQVLTECLLLPGHRMSECVVPGTGQVTKLEHCSKVNPDDFAHQIPHDQNWREIHRYRTEICDGLKKYL